MRFNRVRRAVNIVVAALLLFLFIVPGLYLSRVEAALLPPVARAEQAARSDDAPAAQAALAALAAEAEAYVPPLKLFLDHAAVDALLVAIAAAQPLSEPEDILVAAAGIRAGLSQVVQIERFALKTLF